MDGRNVVWELINKMRFLALLVLVLVGGLPKAAEKSYLPPSGQILEPFPVRYTATVEYKIFKYRGVEVLISPEVNRDALLKLKMIKRMTEQIESIHNILPLRELKSLKPIRIWVELNARRLGYAEYHAYQDWLRENKYTRYQ